MGIFGALKGAFGAAHKPINKAVSKVPGMKGMASKMPGGIGSQQPQGVAPSGSGMAQMLMNARNRQQQMAAPPPNMGMPPPQMPPQMQQLPAMPPQEEMGMEARPMPQPMSPDMGGGPQIGMQPQIGRQGPPQMGQGIAPRLGGFARMMAMRRNPQQMQRPM